MRVCASECECVCYHDSDVSNILANTVFELLDIYMLCHSLLAFYHIPMNHHIYLLCCHNILDLVTNLPCGSLFRAHVGDGADCHASLGHC